jgi:4-diphosphocytidyl-2-C-methyl-D-erythritol kinase
MFVHQSGARVLVHTPAKVNLSLEILGRRSDGYHEIETLIVAASLYDTLELVATDESGIAVQCRWQAGVESQAAARGREPVDLLGDLPAGEKNIVFMALALLRKKAGTSFGAQVSLIKRIPAAAGLGGASSDAAAALVAANAAWGLRWQCDKLADVAGQIGSDVPFFLTGRAAICRGRGEFIEPIRPPRVHLVIVRPPVGLSTPEVYKHCRPADAPLSAAPLAAALARGDMASAARKLNNRLQEPAERLTPWIGRLREEFSRQGVLGHQMSGSGSSYMGLCRHARHARRVACRLRARHVGAAFAATTAAS